ncbi:MAG: diphosphomevalonate decarboxylase [Bacteroidota bacterium]|nr:diphosphomevalonate decarboxylase [Bacteroidota bacterium]
MENLKYGWRSPSNIALIKYWGKTGVQIPANPSISFTLSESHTDTFLYLEEKSSKDEFSIEVLLDGRPEHAFVPKIKEFFGRIQNDLPFLKEYHFRIETHNSFPHSSGIASSASGMSALALCLAEHQLGDPDQDDFLRLASHLSRLGSGSACRSLYGGLVSWGRTPVIPSGSDDHGTPYSGKVHPLFWDFRDTVLLIDKGVKRVSSTAGHGLMHGHPFAENRFSFAHEHLEKLLKTLENGDLEGFGAIVEREALMLHALMMSSSPYFLLMRPETVAVIENIWSFRKDTGLPLYFTLDAGANVHLLYPEGVEQTVLDFVKTSLSTYCKEGAYICDRVGSGPINLK